MMSLQAKLEELYIPFLELPCDVSHYRRLAKKRYVVWSETGEENSFSADNKKKEQQLTGIVDFFTPREFDNIADMIQKILNNQEIGWTLDSIQYEEETNLIHYQWRWWIG